MLDPDGQRGELLDEQAAVAVGRVHRGRRVLGPARTAHEPFLPHKTCKRWHSRLAHGPARLAQERVEDVRREDRTVVQSLGGAAGLERVKLHLAELLTAVVGAAVDGLASEHGLLSTSACRELVQNVVLEALVEAHAEEPRLLENLSRRSTHHRVRVRVAVLDELLERPLGVDVEEGRRILDLPLHDAQSTVEHLEELADGHAPVDALQVDDDVGPHALVGSAHDKRHVLGPKHGPNRSLLAVTRGKLHKQMWKWMESVVNCCCCRRPKRDLLPRTMPRYDPRYTSFV